MGSWEVAAGYRSCEERCELSQRHPRRSPGSNLSRSHAANVDVNVNVEFKVTLHEQVRYRGTLQY